MPSSCGPHLAALAMQILKVMFASSIQAIQRVEDVQVDPGQPVTIDPDKNRQLHQAWHHTAPLLAQAMELHPPLKSNAAPVGSDGALESTDLPERTAAVLFLSDAARPRSAG